MTFDPAKHHRRSIRLKGYDYAQAGAYFVTLVTQGRECVFGEMVDGEMRLNEYGRIAADEWERTPVIRAEIELDAWVVMPNHIHGIIVINPAVVGADGRPPLPAVVRADGRPPRPPTGRPPDIQRAPRSLSSFVAGFKSAATKRINERRGTPGVPVWQRNYYERIIRNENELNRIRKYIADNPLKWELDAENPVLRE